MIFKTVGELVVQGNRKQDCSTTGTKAGEESTEEKNSCSASVEAGRRTGAVLRVGGERLGSTVLLWP